MLVRNVGVLPETSVELTTLNGVNGLGIETSQVEEFVDMSSVFVWNCLEIW